MAVRRSKLWGILGYTPHAGQHAMHQTLDNTETRRLVCLYGRRAGKTHGARFESIYQALRPNDKFGAPLVYVVSDTYAHAKKLFMAIALEFSTKLSPLLDRISVSELSITLKTGAEIWAKSADNAASLAGDGVSFAVVDESGFVGDYSIEVMMPALSERGGQVLAIGTPDHPNWYREWFYLGLDERYGHRSHQFPTSVNPYFPLEELERYRESMPERLFRKYFEAEFIDDENAVFKRDMLTERLTLSPEAPQPDHIYSAGIDVAKVVDYNVVSIFDTSVTPARQVHLERWHGTSWEHTVARIAQLLTRYNNAHAVLDATGVGDPIFEALRGQYPHVEPFKFTAKSKPPLIESLAMGLERGMAQLIDDPVQMDEMSSFQAHSTPTGVKYAAAEGKHDDVVIANALALRGITVPPRQIIIPVTQSRGF